jgi:hypothetical protein
MICLPSHVWSKISGSPVHAASPDDGLAVRQAAADAIQTERSRSNPGFGDLPSVASTVLPRLQQRLVIPTPTPAPAPLPVTHPQQVSRQPGQLPPAPHAQRATDTTQVRPPAQTLPPQQPIAAVHQVNRHILPQPQTQHIQDRPATGPAAQLVAQNPSPQHIPTQQHIPNPGAWSSGTQEQPSQPQPPMGPPSHPTVGGRISAADLAIIRKCLPNIKDLSDDILSNTPSSIRQRPLPSPPTCKWRCTLQRRPRLRNSHHTIQLHKIQG